MGDLFAQDEHFQSTDTPYLDNIGALHFINDDQLIYATDNDIGRFAYASNAWTQKEVYTSSQNDIGAMEGISQLLTNKDDTMLYVLAKKTARTSSPSRLMGSEDHSSWKIAHLGILLLQECQSHQLKNTLPLSLT